MSDHRPLAPTGIHRRPVAITNVTVHTMDGRGTLVGQTVAVEAGTIVRIGPAASVPTDGMAVIEGAGRHLMPGLTDMHAHLFAPTDLDLYLANGVVLVRDLWGSPLRLGMRHFVASGERLGPRIVAGSPIIDGVARDGLPVIPTTTVVTDRRSAAAAARQFISRGYDQLKTYSFLSVAALSGIAEVAGERGVTVTGHCPRASTMEEAGSRGLRCFEHLLEVGAGHLVANAPWPSRMDDRLVATATRFRPDAIRRLGAWLADREVWNCPTLTVHARAIAGQIEPDDPYTPRDMREWWQVQAGADAAARIAPDVVVDGLERIVGLLHDEGAPLLVGADPTNLGVRTGFSVHDELEHLRRAGLTTSEVLRCATVEAARFLGIDEEWGTVAEGMRADLVLTDADPTVDPGTLRRPAAVFANGYVLDRKALDSLLEQRAAALVEPALPALAGSHSGTLEMRQGGVLVGYGVFEDRPAARENRDIRERWNITQMGLRIDRSTTVVLNGAGTVVSARVVDETSVGQSILSIDRTKSGYRLSGQDFDGWQESHTVEVPPLPPSNRLSPVAFTAAAGSIAGTGRLLDLPVAGSLAGAVATTETVAAGDQATLTIHRHGERSTVTSLPLSRGQFSIEEDRFHGPFVTVVSRA